MRDIVTEFFEDDVCVGFVDFMLDGMEVGFDC